MAAPCASLIPSLSAPRVCRLPQSDNKHTPVNTDLFSSLGQAAKQINNEKKIHSISLYTSRHNHKQSLSKSHTLYQCSHTPDYRTCLFAPCSVLAAARQDKEPFGARHFWESRCSSVLPQEGSPQHAAPTGDSGLLSCFLSTVSHTVWLVGLHTKHVTAVHQKTSGSGNVLPTGVCWRMQSSGCRLWMVCSCLFTRCKWWFMWVLCNCFPLCLYGGSLIIRQGNGSSAESEQVPLSCYMSLF